MPEYRSPGVFVEEIPARVRPIEGVPTGTAALVGETERGPLAPHLVTSAAEFQRCFGGRFAAERHLPDAARGFFANGGRRLFVCRVVGAAARTAAASFSNLMVSAAGPGAGGNRIFVRVEPGASEGDFGLRVAYWTRPPENLQDFIATGEPQPDMAEAWAGLSTDPASPGFCLTKVNPTSALITLQLADATSLGPHPGALLAGGADSDVTAADYAGGPTPARPEPQGLAALKADRCREVALVHAPFFPPAQDDVSRAVVAHCETTAFRFAVLDTEPEPSAPARPDPRAAVGPTRNAAAYAPWLRIADPEAGGLREVPPGGFVLGLYARTDRDRGVFRPPAGHPVFGAVDLSAHLAPDRQLQLADRGVNLIRAVPGRGILVWGARTLSDDAEWKYVPVRRLFLFLEHSISEGLHWTAFEPNDERLWARVTTSVQDFLHDLWRTGALQGQTPGEAFFVACGRTTMTEADIREGRLICSIGIAPVRPAEFVILRISQRAVATPP